ncbi:MAG: DUF2891 domain-containing protein [Betaproteobacteria bacterium]
MAHLLTPALAESFARVALENVVTEYPHKLDHLIRGPHDLSAPRALHPAFYGAWDWHSAVHMHWTLARLLRLHPGITSAENISNVFDRHINAETIAQELAYLHEPGRESFERPYGWAWLLKLQADLHLLSASKPGNENWRRWRDQLQPLTELLRDRFITFIAKSDFPVRVGTHGNSAFALVLAHDYAEVMQDRTLVHAISDRANQWFGRDHNYPAAFEPGGSDFLSGGLCEAVLMSRVVDGCSFFDWWQVFRPDHAALANWLLPVTVSDRADPQIGHLAGLNLSRAWCWKMLAASDATDVPADVIQRAIDAHLDATMPHVTHGEFSATHWLATFALLALTQ